jgi:chemotaxis protein methyltransferase CheR
MPESLTNAEFELLTAMARERWGLSIPANKREAVAARLRSHVRKRGLESVAAFVERVQQEGADEDQLVFFDVLSTNVTSFFRDPEHFAHLERELYTGLARGTLAAPGGTVRIWSAACSIGCEPYSLAMHARACLGGGRDRVEILATDLSLSSLEVARRGVYRVEMLEQVPAEFRQSAFAKGTGRCAGWVKIRPEVREMVRVERLNLMESWSGSPAGDEMFHAIFVRNVMIYFDRQTRVELVSRFVRRLLPGGVLVLGSAETLAGMSAELEPVAASIYRK